MNNFLKIILIVTFFSSCSILDEKKNDSSSLEKVYLNENVLTQNYNGMTRKQIIYIFGIPIISDSFNDVYHYHLYYKNSKNIIKKKLLSLYFKNNKVFNFNIQFF